MVSHHPNPNPIPNSISSVSTSKGPGHPQITIKNDPANCSHRNRGPSELPKGCKGRRYPGTSTRCPLDVHWTSPRSSSWQRAIHCSTAYIKPETFPLFVTSALNHWSLFPSSLNNRRGEGYWGKLKGLVVDEEGLFDDSLLMPPVMGCSLYPSLWYRDIVLFVREFVSLLIDYLMIEMCFDIRRGNRGWMEFVLDLIGLVILLYSSVV